MKDFLLTDLVAPGFDDPLGMLAACHRRIERHLATLARLQRHLAENGCDTDARIAARNLLRYFDTAAPNHHADEEASVFPRLQVLAADLAAPLLEELRRDHDRLTLNWRKLRPLVCAIAAGQRANLPPKMVADTIAAYEIHIFKEESDLLPFAAQTLDAEAIAAIGQEMAARRAVEPAAPPRHFGPALQ
jgi:hemerythrin-like domain-containing protein